MITMTGKSTRDATLRSSKGDLYFENIIGFTGLSWINA
jgi:hypothetical protein